MMKKFNFISKIRNKIILIILTSLLCSFLLFLSIAKVSENFFFKEIDEYFEKIYSEENVKTEEISNEETYMMAELNRKNNIYNLYMSGVLLILLISFILLLTVLFDKRTKYLKYITSSLAELSEGNFEIDLDIKGNDEISFLAEKINMMSKKLQDKFEEERELEKNKNILVANLSHDLKSPLTSIIGYAALVKESKQLSETERSYIDIILNNSQRLKTRLDELFEFTKLNNLNLKLNHQMVNISKLIKQYNQEQNSILKTLGFTTKIVVENNIYLDIDIEKFLRIFDNLYSNVKKYGTKPSTFSIQLSKSENKIHLIFRNHFINVNYIDIQKIFNEFYRADEARSDKESTGLGLFIVKRIVELHNGKIWADVKEESYFTINMEFPITNK